MRLVHTIFFEKSDVYKNELPVLEISPEVGVVAADSPKVLLHSNTGSSDKGSFCIYCSSNVFTLK